MRGRCDRPMNVTEETAVLMRAEITRRLTEVPDPVGASCLARGADAQFASGARGWWRGAGFLVAAQRGR